NAKLPVDESGAPLAGAREKAEATITQRTKALMAVYDDLLNQLTMTDPSHRPTLETFTKGRDAWTDLYTVVIAADGLGNEASTQNKWAAKLMDKSHDLFADYETY